MLRAALLLGLMAPACAMDAIPCTSPAIHGDTESFIVSSYDYSQGTLNPEVVAGFNLDLRETVGGDLSSGCGKMDYQAPAPFGDRGVDNQLGPLMGTPVVRGVEFQPKVNTALVSGSLIQVVRVSGIDDRCTDPEVRIELHLAEAVSAEGLITEPQITGGQQVRSIQLLADLPGGIENGRFRSDARESDVVLAFDEQPVMSQSRSTRIAAELRAEGLGHGMLGAWLGATEVAEQLAQLPELQGNLGILRSLLATQADLDPNSAGSCESISFGVAFDAVRAELVE